MTDAKLKINKDLGTGQHIGKKKAKCREHPVALPRHCTKEAVEGGKKGKTLLGDPSVVVPYLQSLSLLNCSCPGLVSRVCP